jgi:uncharacterized membrane protein YeiB
MHVPIQLLALKHCTLTALLIALSERLLPIYVLLLEELVVTTVFQHKKWVDGSCQIVAEAHLFDIGIQQFIHRYNSLVETMLRSSLSVYVFLYVITIMFIFACFVNRSPEATF